jgi:dethiobiotin synthetase
LPRPERLVLVVGTGTEVGKTWVACRLAETLRARGIDVVARKPAQSFDPGTRPEATDAGQLAAATGDEATAVCPSHRWYEVPQAPPMAAAALGRPAFTVADLMHEMAWPEVEVELGLVEGAGGVRSPIADDGDVVDLARLIGPDVVVLVAHSELGVLNVTRLCIEALAGFEVVVHLNHYDDAVDLHRRNLAWLRERWGLDVSLTVPELADRVVRRRPVPGSTV